MKSALRARELPRVSAVAEGALPGSGDVKEGKLMLVCSRPAAVVYDDALTLRLLARSRSGDKQAFEQLLARYTERLSRALQARINNPDLLKDVLQETYLRAFRFIARFRGDCRFYSWLYRIALNAAFNALAAQTRRAEVNLAEWHAQPSATPAPSHAEGPETCLQREQTEQHILHRLAALPLDQRTALTLRMEGCSYHDIAQVLKCPVGTVRSRIARARSRLIGGLGPHHLGDVSALKKPDR